jgi:hypothetical protein
MRVERLDVRVHAKGHASSLKDLPGNILSPGPVPGAPLSVFASIIGASKNEL